MKNITHFKQTLIQSTLVAVIFLSVSSCSQDTKRKESSSDKSTSINEKKTTTTTTTTTINQDKDLEFIAKAEQINMEEISLAQLAQKNGTMSDVKELGRMMEDAHKKSQKDLKALADKKNLEVPTTPTKASKDAYEKLNAKTGSSFDKEYCNMMVNGHKDAIALFEKASEESVDADIKKWAKSMLPDLRKHLEDAMVCQKKCDKLN